MFLLHSQYRIKMVNKTCLAKWQALEYTNSKDLTILTVVTMCLIDAIVCYIKPLANCIFHIKFSGQN
jgi:hypothetical protein